MNDIILDNENDLMISGGDFVVTDSLKQNQKMLLITSKGEWKQHPLTGVGAYDFLKSENYGALHNEIKSQFKADGITVNKITIKNNSITIDAGY